MHSSFLSQVPLFEKLSKEDLKYLSERVETRELSPGEFLIHEGDVGSEAYIILEGQVEILKSSNKVQVLLAVRDKGDLIGEMSLFQDNARTASVRALTESKVIIISKKLLNETISRSPDAAHAIIHSILSRWYSTQSLLKNNEKMAQLGTLSAGLAHELNNPASAIARSAASLEQALDEFFEIEEKIDRMDLAINKHDILADLRLKIKRAAKSPPEFDSLIRSDKEYEFEELLEELGVEDAYLYASSVVDMDFTNEGIRELTNNFSDEEFPVVIEWLEKSFFVYNLQNEISESATRVSSIVKALKDYSYLDKAPLQEIDIHEGIENTLLILRNKLKYGITVKKEYDENIPKIQAYGSELNQVWTNILDNAADALQPYIEKGDPTITIRTKLKPDWIVVDIEDNGPGMKDEVKEKIFNPFFTTKPPGKGTGLGLDISYNIVVEKHGGDIKVISTPESKESAGMTCFKIYLPIDLARIEGKSVMEEFVLPPDEKLLDILDATRTIGVIGYSDQEGHSSHDIPIYLLRKGFEVSVVKPNSDDPPSTINTYNDFKDIPKPLDLALIFTPGNEAKNTVEKAIKRGDVKYIWMQEGVINEEAALLAQNGGLEVVMDTCIRVTHKRLKENE